MRPEFEVHHLPPRSAEVMNDWSHTSTLHIRLHGVERKIVTFFFHNLFRECYCLEIIKHVPAKAQEIRF
jgi:hypothetical protein